MSYPYFVTEKLIIFKWGFSTELLSEIEERRYLFHCYSDRGLMVLLWFVDQKSQSLNVGPLNYVYSPFKCRTIKLRLQSL